MALDGLIFDLDGTLVDTNGFHIEAWVQAFAESGFRIPPDRIAREVGEGGDQLVPRILGETADREFGDALRRRSPKTSRRSSRRNRRACFMARSICCARRRDAD